MNERITLVSLFDQDNLIKINNFTNKIKANSFPLFFNVKINDELEMRQNKTYNILLIEKYNPNDFKFHITIAIDKDYQKIINIKEELEKNFELFDLEVNNIGLYEIYPDNLIKNIKGEMLSE